MGPDIAVGLAGAGTPGPALGSSARRAWIDQGSLPGLLRHELRLVWRASLLGGKHGGMIVAAVMVALHMAGFVVAIGIAQFHVTNMDLLLSGSLMCAFVGGLMVAQAIQRATEVLDGQADLGWLLSAPLPPYRILTSRLISVASSVGFYWFMILGPVANMMALLGRREVLSVYPVLASLALVATSLGFGLTFGVLRLVGPGRTKALANALATLIGATVFLTGQSRALLPKAQGDAVWRWLMPVTDHPAGLGWWPARAALGDAVPLVTIVLIALVVTSVAAWSLDRWFAAGALAAIGNATAAAPLSGAKDRRFRPGVFAALLRKELLLLRRYPSLASLSIYYLIYLIPAGVAIWRGSGGLNARALAVAPVLTAGELARLFVSACVLGDTAPELPGTAPVAPATLRYVKLLAATLGVASILAIPTTFLASKAPSSIPAMAMGLSGVVFCNLLLGLWRPVPLRRTDLKRDYKSWGGLVNVVGLFFSAAWSLATWLGTRGTPWAAAPAVVALGVLLLTRPRVPRPPAS